MLWRWNRFLISFSNQRLAQEAFFLIRLAVGLIFFSQGILKFTDPNMGDARSRRVGFSHPQFMAHFVGSIEIVCGFLVLLGLWTHAASVPL